MIQIIKNILVKLIGFGDMKKLIANFSWLTMDRIVRLGINLFIVGWIARYLGKTQYGLFNYSMSLTILVSALGSLGTNNIIIREVVNHPERKHEILGSAFVMRQIGGVLVVAVSMIAVWIINHDDSLTQMLVFIASLTYMVGSFDVIDLYFQSQIKSKYAVIANNSVFILMSCIRVVLILTKCPLMAFAIAATSEVFVAQIAMVIMYHSTGESIFKWKWNFGVARDMFRDSWPLLLSTISAYLYLRIGQVMLGKMVSYTEVGIYAAAVKISEVWYFVPAMVSVTIYPKLIEIKKINEELFHRRLQEFFSIMALISYGAMIPTFFFNKLIITIIFGEQYVAAGAILSIHIWAGLFYSMGVARSCWCNIMNYTRGTFYSSLAGAIANVLINIPLIPMFGGMGAATATMMARVVAGYLSTIFMSRKIFIMQTKALYLSGLYRLAKQMLMTARREEHETT